jgi:predicted ATP-grasp superfamily ATP-dependent carboligase
MRILVTGAGTFFATRLIHDLGRRGAEVTAGDAQWISPGRASKYASRGLRLPRLGTDPGGYLQAVLNELDARRYDVLLPTFEEALLFAEFRDELRRRTALFLPPFETMLRLHHKPSLDAFCREQGIPSPQTFVVNSFDELRALRPRLPFPAVLKLPTGNNSVGRAYCNDWPTLEEHFRRLAARQNRVGGEIPFVQQRIHGDLVFSLSFCREGQKLAEVVYRTRRTYPQDGGTAAHRESVHHPDVSRINDRLIAATNWSGFIGLDFIVERSSGIPYLIDANTRANPAVHLGFLAGIDWSQLLFDLVAGRTPAPQSARAGINAHSLLLDFGWLLDGLFPGVAPIWKFPQRLFRFLAPAWRVDSRDDLIPLEDPGPVFATIAQTARSVWLSAVSRRPISQVILDDANYDPVAAAKFRCQRLEQAAARRRSVACGRQGSPSDERPHRRAG